MCVSGVGDPLPKRQTIKKFAMATKTCRAAKLYQRPLHRYPNIQYSTGIIRSVTYRTGIATVLCKLVVSLQMQNRKTTDKINEISIVPNPPNYSIVAIADQRALHLHFATDNQLAKPCTWPITVPCFSGCLQLAEAVT